MELNQWSPKEEKKYVVNQSGYKIEYSNGDIGIDIQCGNAAYILGYNIPEILTSISTNPIQFLRGNSGETCTANEELINLICSKGNWHSLSWAVSGSDAVEAAIEMNDQYWAIKGKNKPKIIAFKDSYHGCTMLAKHLRGEYPYLNRAILIDAPKYPSVKRRALFEAAALESIKTTISNNTDIGCLLMETVPWSSAAYSQNWWDTIRQLCTDNDILMIVDDIALCWGKLGYLFGWQKYNVQPDISTISKSLTAGHAPLAAACCNSLVGEVLSTRSWEHTQTYLPNMQGVVAALEATKQIEPLLVNVEAINKRLVTIANNLGIVVRGEGLFLSFDTPKEITMADLYNVGLISTIRGGNTIRVIAPLIADEYYFSQLEARLKRLLYLI